MAKRPVRNLLSLMQNRFFTASTTLPAPPPPPPPSSAAQSSTSALESAMLITDRKAAFSNLLKDYGFKDSQIQKLSESRVAQLDAKRNLKLKLDCFVENGFTGELLHKLIVSSPYIFRGSLSRCIKPRFQFLKQYLDSDEKIVTVINRSKWIICTISFKLIFVPNIEFLINEGVPVNRVSHLLLLQPRALFQNRDRIACAFKTVRESGVAPDDLMFIHALRVVLGLSESYLKKKLEIFKSLGWSDVQTLSILKTYPTCLNLSEEKIRSRSVFLFNTMKLEPEIVIRNPSLLAYKEERIRARYEVLKILKSKKLIRDIKITTAVTFSEDRFLEIYVIKHVERVPGILDMYNAIAHKGKNREEKKNRNMIAEECRFFACD